MAKNKLNSLKKNLEKMQSVLVAFSGGVDSTLLLKLAHDFLGKNAVAATVTSELVSKDEIEEAKKIAEKIGARHLIVKVPVLNKIEKNPINRCYLCKKEIFSKLKRIAEEKNILHVIDGSNYDDTHDFRPGFKALKELGIKSPFVEARMGKEEIRALSKKMDLPTWNKPVSPCLATRIPFGQKITPEKIKIIYKAENYLRELGVNSVRLRHHGDTARIEANKKDFLLIVKHADSIGKYLKKLGFLYAALDLKGYRMGSLNPVHHG